MADKEFRPVNQLLGATPNVGPFPANQVLPWTGILLFGILLGAMFKVPWQWCGMFIIWGIATYWLLTGSNPWKFLARFLKTPRFIRSHPNYISPLVEVEQRRRKSSSRRSSRSFRR